MSITGITEATPSALGVEKEQPQILRRSTPQDDSAENCLFFVYIPSHSPQSLQSPHSENQ
jgi:hypothetical protein